MIDKLIDLLFEELNYKYIDENPTYDNENQLGEEITY